MQNNIKSPRFIVKKYGMKKFRWQLLAPGGQVICSGPGPGVGEVKYLQSEMICRQRIANIKNNAHNWPIED